MIKSTWDIEYGDNLDLLRQQKDEHVDLIYCDVLYGTGRNFRFYKDIQSNYSDVVRFYHPRFTEMRRVLKDTGTIYIHIDYHISHYVRVIMDKIFGPDNFRNEIIWHYNSAPRKKNCFGNRHDTILRYTKTKDFTFNAIREKYSETAPRGYAKEKYYHKDGKVIGDVWDMKMLGQNDKTERMGFPTQKPLALIERIILSSSNEGDLVADYFLGSGTTGIASYTLNRNFYGCDNSEESFFLAKKRFAQFYKQDEKEAM